MLSLLAFPEGSPTAFGSGSLNPAAPFLDGSTAEGEEAGFGSDELAAEGAILIGLSCGDGERDPGEQCGEPGLACTSGKSCNTEYCLCISDRMDPALCGNSKLNPGEECDDGNRSDGDSCSRFCTILFDAADGRRQANAPEDGRRAAGAAADGRDADSALRPAPAAPLGAALSPASPPPASPAAPTRIGASVTAGSHGAAPLQATGPALIAIMAAGAGGGYAWIRRRRRS